MVAGRRKRPKDRVSNTGEAGRRRSPVLDVDRRLLCGGRESLDLDLVGVPHRLGEIVGRLKAQPRVGAAAECLVETDRHLRRNAGMAIDEVGKLPAADAEPLRRLRAGPARFVLHIAPALRYNGKTMTAQRYKIVVERHPEGYVAYPLGLKGVVVGEGETADEAIADVRSAIAFHIETFGDEAVEAEAAGLDAFVTETDLAV